MSEGQSLTGISRTAFIVGLVIAILVSSFISTLAASQLVGIQGLKGEKGEKGDPGLQGPQGEQGLQGEQGPSSVPSWISSSDSIPTLRSNVWTDMQGLTLSITTDRDSALWIWFSSDFNSDGVAQMRVTVDGQSSFPNFVWLGQIENAGWAGFAMQTFVFRSIVFDGTHSIKIQWRLGTDLTTFATIGEAYLFMTALPTY